MRKVSVYLSIFDNGIEDCYDYDCLYISGTDTKEINNYLNAIKDGSIVKEYTNYTHHVCEYNGVFGDLVGDKDIEFIICGIKLNNIDDEAMKVLEAFQYDIERINFENLSLDKINYVLSSFDFKENIEIVSKYDYGFYDRSKKEIVYATEYIHNIRDYILQFDFSPLEQCILLYDLLRERNYKYNEYDKLKHDYKDKKISSDEYEKKSLKMLNRVCESRSLFCTMESDEIVCTGFANIYMAVLESLGISTNVIEYFSRNDNTGHASNIVVINDPKYEINQIVEIDTTWGRVYNEDGKYNYRKSLFNYEEFGKSLFRAIAEKDLSKKYTIDRGYPNEFKDLYVSLKQLEKFFELGAPCCVLRSPLGSLRGRLGQLGEKYNIDLFTDFVEEINNAFDSETFNEEIAKALYVKIKRSLLEPIEPSKFCRALKVVKLCEHKVNPRKYPYNEDLIQVAFKSCYEPVASPKFDLRILTLMGLIEYSIKDVDISHLDGMELGRNPVLNVFKRR